MIHQLHCKVDPKLVEKAKAVTRRRTGGNLSALVTLLLTAAVEQEDKMFRLLMPKTKRRK